MGVQALSPCHPSLPSPKDAVPHQEPVVSQLPNQLEPYKIAKEETRWPCPQPPSPGTLSLGLTARAHATDYFLANFFSDFPRHFLRR